MDERVRIRVSLLSNSQGTSAGVAAGEAYPVRLRTLLGSAYEVHWLLMSGWTIADLRPHLRDNVVALEPDVVVLNYGIVEAAQRILAPRAKRVLATTPWGRWITGALHARRSSVLRLRERAGVQTRLMAPGSFAEMVVAIAAELEAAGIAVLFLEMPEIPDGGAALRHPFVNDDIRLFNSLLPAGKTIRLPAVAPEGSLLQDGTVHFSPMGHLVVAETLAAAISNRMAGDRCDR